MSITAVWGPPQSGKTTLCIDLAYALSQSGRSVCLISPELYSELAARMNLKIQKDKSLAAAQKNNESLEQIVHKVDDLLFVLAAPYDHDAFGEGISNAVAKSVLEEAKELFDIVLVDCPSHTGSAVAAWGLSSAAAVLMMSGAHSSAVIWNNAYRRAVDAVEDKTFHICSRINRTFDYRTLHDMLDVTPEVWLPHYPDAAMEQLLKHTLYRQNGKLGRDYISGIDLICQLICVEDGDSD